MTDIHVYDDAKAEQSDPISPDELKPGLASTTPAVAYNVIIERS